MVISLLLRLSIVRQAMMAGTLQPKPHDQRDERFAVQAEPVHHATMMNAARAR